VKDSDLSTTAARDAARIVWFKRYPAKQTLIAFLLALLATTAFSIDPAPVSSNAVLAIDPKASGMLYVCYEVLLSFAGHTDAVMLLALACLLTLPFRYVFFGRGDTWRPSIILPSLFFTICMVFGRSYDLTDSAEIVLGDKARIICAWIGGAGWMLLAIVAFYLAFECLDWLSSRRIPFSEAHFGRVWRVTHAVLSVHPFAGPFLVLMIAWTPTLIASLPGLFMGDTGAQIRQWFNYPNGTSDYLRLLNPNVLLNVCSRWLFIKYGYELTDAISREMSIAAGTLYMILKRLKEAGYVETYLQESASGPARKYYHLTEAGTAYQQEKKQEWLDFTQQINRLISDETI